MNLIVAHPGSLFQYEKNEVIAVIKLYINTYTVIPDNSLKNSHKSSRAQSLLKY
ncbi:MAG: hypothetical protein ACP5IE_10240 [Infirmifilum sp.]|uniref:hypothetical protein n=1 Tax=Infirmifilum uzonense TaxID=1550241 RepID=UPI003C736F68